MNLPKRKPTRLNGYDYSTPGLYFLTICVKNKEPLLGHIVGCGDFDAPNRVNTPTMILSEHGQIFRKYLQLMAGKYPHITVDHFVIMPNHVHLLVRITDNGNGTSETAVPYGVNGENGASETAAPYNGEIPKFVSLLKRYCNREYGRNIWQSSYHDHIIRGEADYRKIWEYIDTNVNRWRKDCFYSDKRS